MRAQILDFIREKTNSGAFVKLNWSAPRDASWLNPTLQCVTADEIFTLLKSSTFITHDVRCPFNECIPGFVADQYYMVLKRWHNLNKGMEFRCFIKNNLLVGISQRDITAYYEFLPALKSSITTDLTEFCNETNFIEDSDFIVDVYVENRQAKVKIWLLDINPWIPVCVDSLLFTWEELEQCEISPPQFRIIENDYKIKANDIHGYRVPVVSIINIDYGFCRTLRV